MGKDGIGRFYPLSPQNSEDINQCGKNSWNIEEIIKEVEAKYGGKYRLVNVRLTKSEIYFSFNLIEEG